jgi:hypothetical protein
MHRARPRPNISIKTAAGLVIDGSQKLLQDLDAWLGQAPGTREPDPARQLFEVATQYGYGIGESGKAGIATHFAHHAQDADCAQLFEDVGIAKNGGLNRCRFVFRLVLPNGIQDRGHLRFRKTRPVQDLRTAGTRIGNMVPASQLTRILWTMPDKHTQVVQPCSRQNDVAVIREAGTDGLGERREPRLVAKLVNRTSLGLNVTRQSSHVISTHETFVTRKS